MTTIVFDENMQLGKTHFKSVEEFQLYLIKIRQKSGLSEAHKKILDTRIEDAHSNPDNFISLEALKSSLNKK